MRISESSGRHSFEAEGDPAEVIAALVAWRSRVDGVDPDEEEPKVVGTGVHMSGPVRRTYDTDSLYAYSPVIQAGFRPNQEMGLTS